MSICVLEEDIRDCVFDIMTTCCLARLDEGNFTSIKASDCLFDAFPYLIQDVGRVSYDELIAACKKMSECVAPRLRSQREI